MLTILRHRNFTLLWFASLISVIGDTVIFIALPFYVYALTGSTLATGTMFIAGALPRVLLGSVAGVFVDRWDRKRTMIVADLLRGSLLLLLLLVRSADWLWLLYLVAFLEPVIAQFFLPAKNALIPTLLDEQQLVPANSLTALSDEFALLIAAPLAGVLLELLGLNSLVLLDSASFLLSAVLIGLISMPSNVIGEASSSKATVGASWVGLWHEWLEGLKLVRRERLISGVFLARGTMMISEGILVVLIVVFVQKVLGGGALELGWLLTARAVGGLLGGFVMGQAAKRLPLWQLTAFSAAANGVFLLGTFNLPVFWLRLITLLLAGITVMGWVIATQTLLQINVAEDYLGRVFGAFDTTEALLMLVGMGLATALGDVLGVLPWLNIAGSLYIVAAVIALAMLRGTSSVALHNEESVAGN